VWLILMSSMKFADVKGFAKIVAKYKILPERFVAPASYAYVFVEFIFGWWILSGQYLLYASYAGLALILVADVFLLKAVIQKKQIVNVGCYGTIINSPASMLKVVEMLVWTVLFVLLVLAARTAGGMI